ncbi:hypothetical protein EYF80_053313 [Liparis tanakae]|uniref:Uncharacterized protein n=1 Tax=Liparis tanakae TaxID=230148 RepID=A0A4Z2F600_9TELE|nr:hypothetical protein EYF80_053313 [Liparis tanakae]
MNDVDTQNASRGLGAACGGGPYPARGPQLGDRCSRSTLSITFILSDLLCLNGSGLGSILREVSYCRVDQNKLKQPKHVAYRHQYRPQRLLDAGHHVDPPVGLHRPALLLTPQDLLEEVLLGLGLALLLLQRLPQVDDVFCGAQLRDAGQQHEGEEGDQQAGVAAQGQVGLDAGVLVQRLLRPLLRPMTCTKSGVRTNGTRSLLTPRKDFLLPRMWPKSMWNRFPEGRRRTASVYSSVSG